MTNILRSKDNQAMKFGQLIEYNLRDIFLEKSYTKSNEKLFRDPFLKNQNRAYLYQCSKCFIYFVFIVYQVEN